MLFHCKIVCNAGHYCMETSFEQLQMGEKVKACHHYATNGEVKV